MPIYLYSFISQWKNVYDTIEENLWSLLITMCPMEE